MLSENNKVWDETEFWKISGFDHAWFKAAVNVAMLLWWQLAVYLTDALPKFLSWGLYYKHITIVNYDSRVITLTTLDSRMTLQIVSSITIVILTTVEVSVVLQENMYIVQAGNIKRGSITVPLTSCLTGLD